MHYGGNVIPKDPSQEGAMTLTVEGVFNGVGKARALDTVTITSITPHAMTAASYMFESFANNDFEGLTCKDMRDLFRIARDTPIYVKEKEVEIVLSKDQENDTTLGVKNIFEGIDFNGPMLIATPYNSGNIPQFFGRDQTAKITRARWKTATPFERVEVYKGFLESAYTSRTPQLFEVLYGIEETDFENPELSERSSRGYTINLEAVATKVAQEEKNALVQEENTEQDRYQETPKSPWSEIEDDTTKNTTKEPSKDYTPLEEPTPTEKVFVEKKNQSKKQVHRQELDLSMSVKEQSLTA